MKLLTTKNTMVFFVGWTFLITGLVAAKYLIIPVPDYLRISISR